MKVSTAFNTKTVLYGGKILRVSDQVKYIAADKDGTVHGFRTRPVAVKENGFWNGVSDRTNVSAQVDWTCREHDRGAWVHSMRACDKDEGWMLFTAGKAAAGLDLFANGQHDAVKEVFKEVAACLEDVAKNETLNLQELYKIFITHSGCGIKEGSEAEVELRGIVLPAPAYRKIQYHGATFFVPPDAEWVVTDYNVATGNGMVLAYVDRPLRRPVAFYWYTTTKSKYTTIGWLPSSVAEAAWKEEPQRVEDLEVE